MAKSVLPWTLVALCSLAVLATCWASLGPDDPADENDAGLPDDAGVEDDAGVPWDAGPRPLPCPGAGEPWLCTVLPTENLVVAGTCRTSDGRFGVVGSFKGNATFGDGRGQDVALKAASGTDGFYAEVADDGALVRLIQLAGNGNQHALTCGKAHGGMHVAGTFDQEVSWSGGAETLTAESASDAFLLGLPAPPEVPVLSHLVAGQVTGLRYSSDGLGSYALLSGAFRGTVRWLPGTEDERVLVSRGGTDIFSQAGTYGGLLYVVGGPGEELLGDVSIMGSSSGYGCGDCWTKQWSIVGSFSDGAVFNAGTEDEVTATSQGGLDVFLVHVLGAPYSQFSALTTLGGPGDDIATGVVAGGPGAVVVGTFGGGAAHASATFGDRSATSVGGADVFVAGVDWEGGVSLVTVGSPDDDRPLRLTASYAETFHSNIELHSANVEGSFGAASGGDLETATLPARVRCPDGPGVFALGVAMVEDSETYHTEIQAESLSGGCASVCDQRRLLCNR